MTKPKVLISDKMDPNAARIFAERGCEVDEKVGLSKDELIAIIGEQEVAAGTVHVRDVARGIEVDVRHDELVESLRAAHAGRHAVRWPGVSDR